MDSWSDGACGCGCGNSVAVTGEDPVTVQSNGFVRGQEGRLKITSRPIEVTRTVTGSRDIGDRSRRGKIGVTGPGQTIASISGIAVSGQAGNYQGCTIV